MVHLRHFEKMPAPDRPMAGAFATVQSTDKARINEAVGQVDPLHFAPTRSGAGILSNSLLNRRH